MLVPLFRRSRWFLTLGTPQDPHLVDDASCIFSMVPGWLQTAHRAAHWGEREGGFMFSCQGIGQ